MKIVYKDKVPSKTFLLGEYAVLNRSPAVVMNTNPGFQLLVGESPNKPEFQGFNSKGPARRLIQKFAADFSGYQFHFKDYNSFRGGVGASTAEFALLFRFLIERGAIQKKMTLSEIVNFYQQFAWNGKGPKPSGYDLISQLGHGNIGYIDVNKDICQFFTWVFPEKNILFYKTKIKIPTHIHLESIQSADLKFNTETIKKLKGSFETKDFSVLVRAVDEYYEQLDHFNLIHAEVRSLCQTIRNIKGVETCKGCGALGADVIIVFIDDSQKTQVIKNLEKLDIEYYCDKQELFERNVN